jgi:hypothetical protein
MPKVGGSISTQQGSHERSESAAGSFRDPSGFVFVQDGVLYRQVNDCYRPHYQRLIESGLAADLMGAGLLIPHEEVPLRDNHDPAAFKVLRPERVPFVSYPYEWSFSQLRDAALLTLTVQMRALKFRMSLKDASAFNIQFLRGRPVFIDTLSFEIGVDDQPWVAYRQFCQHFLGPLALMAYRDVRLNQLLRVWLDGVPLDLTGELLPWRTRFKPSLAMHLHLHARAQKRYAGRAMPGPVKRRRFSRMALMGLVESLTTAIRGLRWIPQGTEWDDYYRDTNYSDRALAEKERIVAGMLNGLRPTVVWDLGANVGRFSRIASRNGIMTVAFDSDPAAVEKNYVETVASRDAHLLPLLVDLTNPSASVGWAGAERLSLEQRGPADVVLVLALVHHLAIGNNVPFADIAAWLSRIARHIVIEFVPKADSQVERMFLSRPDTFEHYTQPAFENAFRQYFEIEVKEPVPDTQRTLYQMRRC